MAEFDLPVPLIERCPFCRSRVALDEIDRSVFAVCCETCGAIGPHRPAGTQSELEAVLRWNAAVQRVSPP